MAQSIVPAWRYIAFPIQDSKALFTTHCDGIRSAGLVPDTGDPA